MKKGSKLADVQYFLEIKDLQYQPFYLAGGLSLREAVRLASQHVTDMDTYSKVYRELRAMQGAYAGLFFSLQGEKKPITVFVLIREYPKPSAEEELTTLAQIDQLEDDIRTGIVKIPRSPK